MHGRYGIVVSMSHVPAWSALATGLHSLAVELFEACTH